MSLWELGLLLASFYVMTELPMQIFLRLITTSTTDNVGKTEDERIEDGADESEGRQHWTSDPTVRGEIHSASWGHLYWERDGPRRHRNSTEIPAGTDLQDSQDVPRDESHGRDDKV